MANIPSANPYSRDAINFYRDRGTDMESQIKSIEQSKVNTDRAKKLALTAEALITGTALAPSVAGLFTGGAPAFGPGAAGTGAWTTSVGAAPSIAGVLPSTSLIPGALSNAGQMSMSSVVPGVSKAVAPSAMSRIGDIFNSKGMNLGVNTALALKQNSSQSNATDQARKDLLEGNAASLALQRERLEREMANAALTREDALAATKALNELKRRELDAAEEVRKFDREQAQYVRSKDEALEARRAPYRQAGSAALARLNSIWGI